ncbi:hypothetical protein [Microbispora catharanthi]|uniref:Uncharacterized protein n=1 Tax=Microbispora catharanthi TaxID=1712871 RepID=A0A5N6C1G9_9ACTN|nr:hypothetical protein [Microbispora catharanthi]KAB8186539.1 hypothetical protein FH610_007060 [Microbispora catharanthi]
MTDTSGGATNPFAGLATSMGAGGGAVDPRLTDPEFKMDYNEVTKFGNDVAGRGQVLADTSGRIKNIHLPMLTFGVIGGGLNGVHSQLRNQTADAVAKGKEVLESWKSALDQAVENAKEAEKQSSGGHGKVDVPGGPKGPGFDPKKLGLGGGVPKVGAGSDLGNDWKLPKDKLGTDLDDSLKHPDLPDTGTLPGPGGSDGGLPGNGLDPNGTGVGGGGGLDPNGAGLGRTGLDGLGQNGLGTQNPTGPGGTALSAYNPNPASVPTVPNLGTTGYGPGDHTTGNWPGTGGTGTGGYGSGASGTGGAAGYGTAGRGGVGTGGMAGMPYAPMAGAGAGSNDDGKERARGPAVPEDESTWFGDEDVAPPVLGMHEEI